MKTVFLICGVGLWMICGCEEMMIDETDDTSSAAASSAEKRFVDSSNDRELATEVEAPNASAGDILDNSPDNESVSDKLSATREIADDSIGDDAYMPRSGSTSGSYTAYGTVPKLRACTDNTCSTDGAWWEYNSGRDNMELWMRDSGTGLFSMAVDNSNGFVGIGTQSPLARLDVLGDDNNGTNAALSVRSGSQQMIFDGNELDCTSGSLYINLNSENNTILNRNGGGVGIGTSTPDYALDVHGTIRAEEVIVENFTADFVFEDNYYLMPLEDVEDYIVENGHLPEIPDAKSVETNGSNLGQTQTKLLQKIEELTLHLIAQDKEIKALKDRQDRCAASQR